GSQSGTSNGAFIAALPMEEMVSSLGQIRSAVGQEAYDSASLCIRRAGELLRGCAAFGLMAVLFACLATPAHAKQDDRDWIAQIRTLAAAQDWDGAMKVVEQQAATRPTDVEVREWRARVLTWSGKLDAA